MAIEAELCPEKPGQKVAIMGGGLVQEQKSDPPRRKGMHDHRDEVPPLRKKSIPSTGEG